MSVKIIFFSIFFSEHTTKEIPDDDTIPILLLWAILFNRIELSEILWLQGKDHLCKIKILILSFKKNKTRCIILFEVGFKISQLSALFVLRIQISLVVDIILYISFVICN